MLLLNLNNLKLVNNMKDGIIKTDYTVCTLLYILTVQPTINHISETPAIPLKQSNEGGAETQITISNANHRGV